MLVVASVWELSGDEESVAEENLAILIGWEYPQKVWRVELQADATPSAGLAEIMSYHLHRYR